jgi:hypothetical protein
MTNSGLTKLKSDGRLQEQIIAQKIKSKITA